MFEYDTFYLGVDGRRNLGRFIPTVSVIIEEVHLETCITIIPPSVHIETYTQEEPRDEYFMVGGAKVEGILEVEPQRFF